MGTSLASLVNSYGQDPHGSGRRIRELLHCDRHRFSEEALECLRIAHDERGVRYLLAVLTTSGLLLDGLAHPSVPREWAMQMARSAAQVSPALASAVVRRLLERGPRSLSEDAAVSRLLEILDVVADTSSLPALTQLLDHPDDRVRSKAALIIGRGTRSARWVERRLNESDARVRANAIEALWDIDSEHCRRVLWNAAEDKNNRVAGNALLGLYRLGEPASISHILDMWSDSCEMYRMTAAWIMGQSRDPRFLPVLAPALATARGGLRRRVFSAVSNIKQFVARAQQAGSLALAAADSGIAGEPGWRRLRISVAGGPPDLRLPATRFLVSAGGTAVTRFRGAPSGAVQALSAGFVIPGQFGDPPVDLLEQCIKCRRPADAWAAVKYASGGAANEPVIRFASDSATLAGLFATADPHEQAPDLDAAARRMARAISGKGGPRHMVVAEYRDRMPPEGIQELYALAAAGKISIHAASDNAQSDLRDLCGETGGVFLAAGPDTFPERMERICRLLAPWGEVELPAAAEVSLRIQVYAPEGYGEMII